MSRGSETGLKAEALLGSRGRVRVLGVLAESGELNITEVARRANLNYTSAERHLARLKGMGLVREKRYGKVRIFEAAFGAVNITFERERGVRVEVEPPRRDRDELPDRGPRR